MAVDIVIYNPIPWPSNSKTPAFVPAFLRGLRALAVLTIDWATLSYMEHAPRYVVIGLGTVSALVIGMLESKQWLDFKGKYYFGGSLAVLLLAYILICLSPMVSHWTERPEAAASNSTSLPPPVMPAPAATILPTETTSPLLEIIDLPLSIIRGWDGREDKFLVGQVLITADSSQDKFKKVMMDIFSVAQIGARQHPGKEDLDFPKLKYARVPGITVHGDNPLSWLLYNSLDHCFVVSRAGNISGDLANYYHSPKNEALVWLEIGAGPIWKTPRC